MTKYSFRGFRRQTIITWQVLLRFICILFTVEFSKIKITTCGSFETEQSKLCKVMEQFWPK